MKLTKKQIERAREIRKLAAEKHGCPLSEIDWFSCCWMSVRGESLPFESSNIVKVTCYSNTYKRRQTLKNKGYKYDGETRTWSKEVEKNDLFLEEDILEKMNISYRLGDKVNTETKTFKLHPLAPELNEGDDNAYSFGHRRKGYCRECNLYTELRGGVCVDCE